MHRSHTRTIPSSLHIVFLSALVVFTCLYLYLIQSSVVSVIERRAFEHKAAQLESELATLEGSYVRLIGSVTLTEAYAHGFVDASSVTGYARAHTPSAGVTMRHGN